MDIILPFGLISIVLLYCAIASPSTQNRRSKKRKQKGKNR